MYGENLTINAIRRAQSLPSQHGRLPKVMLLATRDTKGMLLRVQGDTHLIRDLQTIYGVPIRFFDSEKEMHAYGYCHAAEYDSIIVVDGVTVKEWLNQNSTGTAWQEAPFFVQMKPSIWE